MGGVARYICAVLCALSLAATVHADIYMHTPRGSNNRNCGRSNNQNREEATRLFDSQNNDKGGYSCPRAHPFPCYKYEGTERAACNDQNQNGGKDRVDRFGNVVIKDTPFNCNPDAIAPPTFAPTLQPTPPTPAPTLGPTDPPTTDSPTNTQAPSAPPTDAPSDPPTDAPSSEAPTTEAPSDPPTDAPSDPPTEAPSVPPSDAPSTEAPSTEAPSDPPTDAPTTASPTDQPSDPVRRLQGLPPCEIIQNGRMEYCSGSLLTIEWTNQHGMGRNEKLHSQVIVQYALEDDMEDNCGEIDPNDATSMPWGTFPSLTRKCHMRDGYPVNNRNTQEADRLNGQAVNRIPEDETVQDDYRYGRHETYQYYRECRYRKRNQGLFIADQGVGNNQGATRTRQNPGGTRYGYECAEESAYYPYWHWSPWRDIAAIVSPFEFDNRCRFIQRESQNTRGKNRCRGCPECRDVNGQPNNRVECVASGGQWVTDPAWGMEAPACFVGKFNRQNHLGNSEGQGSSNQVNWTLPAVSKPTMAVIRIRYNISTGDYNEVSLKGDSGSGQFLRDDDGSLASEAASYKAFLDGTEVLPDQLITKRQLSLAVNSNQHGRVFQDRSYAFVIKPCPNACPSGRIHNLNVRGKRGNIVQAYPAVEYDFAPSRLVVNPNDCVHFQWDGSDYNVNRGGNNGDGGPYDPERADNGRSRTDRTNLVQAFLPRHNQPMWFVPNHTMFRIPASKIVELAFLGQPIDNPAVCMPVQSMQADPELDNVQKREYTYKNCAKLAGLNRPYFNAGVLPVGPPGTYYFMATRNNHFSNRGHKGVLIVNEDPLIGLYIFIGVFSFLLLAGAAAFYVRRKRKREGKQVMSLSAVKDRALEKVALNTPSFEGVVGSAAVGTAKVTRVRAIHSNTADEEGELSFRVGDVIDVIRKDPSGWWEGELNGERGIFPANYTKRL